MGVLFKVYFEKTYDNINCFFFTKSWGSNVFLTLLRTRLMSVMVNVEFMSWSIMSKVPISPPSKV